MNLILPWSMSSDGRHLYNDRHRADVRIDIDGNCDSEEERVAFARNLMSQLNGVPITP